MSYVTLDRICQEKVDKDGVPLKSVRNGRPPRSSAGPLSDDELLAKLRDLGLDVDRDGVERLCEGALSAEEVARLIVKKLIWLDAWADVLRLCDATGISSIEEFDERFPLTQSVFNWSQDLEMALENAGRDDGELRQALIEFCEESLRRFPGEDQLTIENRRQALGGAYFGAGLTEKAEELFGSWLDADPAWGWGWIGWADCYLPWGGRAADFGRAEKILQRGYRVPGVRDRADIADRLREACEGSGRPDEARQFAEQAERLRQKPLRPATTTAPPPGPTARRVKVGRNDPCPCGSGKKYKKCRL